MAQELEASSEISREGLKSLFYILAGKPDSILKVFKEPFVLTVQDLHELNEQMHEKLAQHHIEAVVITFDVAYEGGIIKQFGSWKDFIDSPLSGPEVTESVNLRWDMMVKLPSYKLPQRHTVTLRAASSISTSQILQYLLSVEDIQKLDFEMAPIFCRVDFISHLLSQEIINIVTRWYDARPKPIVYSSLYYKLKKHRARIAGLIRYSIPTLISVVAGALLIQLVPQASPIEPVTQLQMRTFMLWLLFSALGIYAASRIGRWLGSKAHESLSNFVQFGTFNITRGDQNKQAKIEQENHDAARAFVWSTVGAVVINVISGIIAALLLGS